MLIDTDKAREELIRSGVPEEQARAHINVVRMMDEQARARLATKDDIALLRKDLEQLEQRMEQKMETLRADLLRAMNRRALAVIGTILGGMWALLELYL